MLEAVGRAAAIIDENRRLIAANASMQALIPTVFADTLKYLRFISPAADALFCAALCNRQLGAFTCALALPGDNERLPMVVHVGPAQGAGLNVLSRPAFLVVVTVVTPIAAPSAALVEVLFCLTPAEANIARWIVAGRTIDEIATDSGTLPSTARTQMRAVLNKPRVRRQAQLVSLLGSIKL